MVASPVVPKIIYVYNAINNLPTSKEIVHAKLINMSKTKPTANHAQYLSHIALLAHHLIHALLVLLILTDHLIKVNVTV